MTVVGLVVEGTNDYPIIQAFLESELPDIYSRPIHVRHLQPEADATSGKYRGGGWGRVVGWCKAYAGNQLETYFNPIEEGDVACDLILVQLDGDAVNECAAHSSVKPLPENCTPLDRVNALSEMTAEWLTIASNRAGQIRFAFPVMHSEAWILAALRPNVENWEVSNDSKTPLRALKPSHPKTSVAAFYMTVAVEASKNGNLIATQSQSFAEFRKKLTT